MFALWLRNPLLGIYTKDVVQSLSCATPWTAGCQAPMSSTISHSLLKFTFIEPVMLSNHLFLCLLLLLPPIFPRIRVFSNESALCIRWPKYWSFSISPSNEYSGLISFGIDWFNLLAVQGTLKSLPQHHNLKASILPRSAFFVTQKLPSAKLWKVTQGCSLSCCL